MPSLEDLERRLDQQQQMIEVIYKNSEKVRKYILWGRIMSTVYIVLIFAPLILAAIYLPPLLKNAIGPYQELLGTFGSSAGPLGKEKKVEGALGEFGNLQNLLNDFGVKVEQQPK